MQEQRVSPGIAAPDRVVKVFVHRSGRDSFLHHTTVNTKQAATATKKTHTLCLQVPPDLIRGLRAMAKYDGKNHDEYVVEILTGAVDAYRGDRQATRKANSMGMTLREYEEKTMPRFGLSIAPVVIDMLTDRVAAKIAKGEGVAAS